MTTPSRCRFESLQHGDQVDGVALWVGAGERWRRGLRGRVVLGVLLGPRTVVEVEPPGASSSRRGCRRGRLDLSGSRCRGGPPGPLAVGWCPLPQPANYQ